MMEKYMNIRSTIFLFLAVFIPSATALEQATEQLQGLDAILAQPEGLASKETPSAQETGKETDVTLTETTQPKDIYLNFDNAELSSFINYIGEIKKLNLITDKNIEGSKISLTIRKPLSVDGAWKVFLTTLEMAGFSIIQVGDVYKIIQKAQKGKQPLPAYINTPYEKIPDNDSNIRYVIMFANLKEKDMVEFTKSMMSAEGMLTEIQDVNGLVIMDKCYNIRTAARVLQELDQMGTAETVSMIPLKNANADEVKKLLTDLIQQPEISPIAQLLGKTPEGGIKFFPPGTRIIAEPRTNKLILIGHPKPIKVIEDFIKNHIDTELKDLKSPVHIYELQNTNAQQIASILKEVIEPPVSDAGKTAAKYGSVRGGVKFFKPMTFNVDEAGNRLIVVCTDDDDWKLLRQTIEDLDKPQPQVAIETLIAMVTVDDTKKMGGNTRLKNPNQIGANTGFQSAAANSSGPSVLFNSDDGETPVSLFGNMMGQLAMQQGLTALTFGNPGTNGTGIWGVFSMLNSISNTTVLARPFVTTANKQKAQIEIGQTIRVQQATSGTGNSQQVGYEDYPAKYNLILTPQINLDGLIHMEIDTKIEDITKASDVNPEKTTRVLKTNVSVADGQVLVLGGFVQTQVTESIYKTPLLGDLPILGWLFKNKNRTVTKKYLFIFLNPTIIKPRTKPGIGLYATMKLHEVTDSIEDSIPTRKLPDPVNNWFFGAGKENYSHKVIDFANARYQPTTVDIKYDSFYRSLSEQKKGTLKQEPVVSLTPQKQSLNTITQEQKDAKKAAEELTIDADKRNTLKEFLAHGRATT